ncbi:MAG TPA: hypothetical protein VLF79_00050 [Candidatus Saccharimonadales bacterium]|nr:hypothetical protein [Candidatus Saccharimonadales bacterium]
MFADIIKIAVLCVFIGGASIPVSFVINTSPWVVWFGNALGSLFSAVVVIYICERITSKKFRNKAVKRRLGKKVVEVYEEGDDNKKVLKARVLIDKHGLRVFSFLCPIFPGVLVSTIAVYVLNLDKHIYKKWMYTGVFIASGFYVFSYWLVFVR